MPVVNQPGVQDLSRCSSDVDVCEWHCCSFVVHTFYMSPVYYQDHLLRIVVYNRNLKRKTCLEVSKMSYFVSCHGDFVKLITSLYLFVWKVIPIYQNLFVSEERLTTITSRKLILLSQFLQWLKTQDISLMNKSTWKYPMSNSALQQTDKLH